MAFGGAVKLTGESEYKRALTQITQKLRETAAEMRTVTSAYDKNDKSTTALNAKSQVLNKTLTEQTNKLNTLKAQYSAMSSQYTTQTAKHTQLVNSYNTEKAKLEQIGQTLGITSDEYNKQKEIVDALTKEVTKSTNAQDANEESMSKMRVQISNAETDINNTKRSLDDLGKKAKESGSAAEKAAEGFTTFKGVVANLTSQAITEVINGLKKLGRALVDLGQQSIGSYAQYEQLIGGVETLFKDSAPIVEGYAQNAYKTAQMSANQYMETVTGFSASLLQGLGGDTQKAAEYAHMAVVDMSDNAAKMGTSMYMIQNAYQGFAKDNYTMLDNLKLGYGGTQAEMARLVNESGVMGDSFKATAENVKDIPFDKLIEAIHKTQQQMGITGTTAEEASDTIEGSTNSMKAAWSNLLTSIADDNSDLSQSTDIFVDSAVQSADNMVPRIKRVVEGIKTMINSIVTEAFPRLKNEIPELRPLIETFEWFINNQGLVVGALNTMLAAFAVTKVLQFTKSMSDGTKAIIDFVKNVALATTAANVNTAAQTANTAAQVAGTGATTGLTVATNLLNAAWKANPIGLVITGITLLISTIALLKGKTEEMTEAEKEQQKQLEEQKGKIEENSRAWEDLTQKKQDAINVGYTEMANYQSLANELDTIVDKNGKVKEGYEARASFITSTLSEALGIEMSLTDGVIQKYDSIKQKISEVIEQKKAKILLDSQEGMYTEALTKQDEVLRQLSSTGQILTQQRTEEIALQDQLTAAEKRSSEAARTGNIDAMKGLYLEINGIQQKLDAKHKEVEETQGMYTQLEGQYQQYAYNIGQYENNMALFHEGKYNEMSTATWDYVKDYQNAGDAEKAQLEDNIAITKMKLDELKKLRDESGSDIYNSQIAANEQLLSEQEAALEQYNSTTGNKLGETHVIWSDSLDDNLSAITGQNIEFRDAGDGNVQMYIDGVKSGETKSKEDMAALVEATIKEITNKKGEADTAGQDLIEGVNNGINNQDKQSSVFTSIASFGKSLLEKLRASLQESSPSKATKEMGGYLLEGLNIGINKKTRKSLKTVNSFGKLLLKEIRNVFGIASPAKTTQKDGAYLVEGLDVGIKENEEKVLYTVDEFASDMIDTMRNSKDGFADVGKDLVDTMTNGITSGVDNNKEIVQETIDNAIESIAENLESDAKQQYNDLGRSLMNAYTEGMTEEAARSKNTIQEAYNALTSVFEQRDTLHKKFLDIGSLTISDGNQSFLSVDAQKIETQWLNEYASMLRAVRERIPDSMFQEILEMNMEEAVPLLRNILGMSDSYLNEFIEAYTERLDTAQRLADEFYADDIKNVKTKFIDVVQGEFASLNTNLNNAGMNAIQGFITGMQSKQPELVETAQSIANSVVDAMQTELDIHSPSRVMRDKIGKNIAAGIAAGITAGKGLVTNAITSAVPTKINIQSIKNSKNTGNNNLVMSFKKALSEMKIELDDEVAGKFVDRTVTKLIYS